MRITAWLIALLLLAQPATALANPFFFTGGVDSEFLTEANYTENADGTGASPADGSIDDGGLDITLDLVIDGDLVQSSGDIDVGTLDGSSSTGSLTINSGGSLSIADNDDNLDINADGAFNLADATLEFTGGGEVFLGGTIVTNNGEVDSGDDIEFQASARLTIQGTTFRADDNIFFDDFDASDSVIGATFLPADRFGVNASDANVVLTDTTITINGGDDDGDIEDLASDIDGNEAGTLTLLGASALTADDLLEGADLVLGGSSTAVLGVLSVADGDDVDDSTYVGGEGAAGEGSSVTLISLAALLTVPDLDIVDGIDPTEFIFNGLGAGSVSLSENPTAFLVTPLAGGGFTIQAVPEPHAAALLLIGFAAAGFGARRKIA